ncbi:MAG: N-acetyl-D-Glu racemase DgcA [Pseudomonadota bacterium]
MNYCLHRESWSTRSPFRITGVEFNEFCNVVVELVEDDSLGRGEALGIFYLDDTPSSIVETLEHLRPRVEAGIDRVALQTLLPPGGARNALDCALWDLEAKKTGKSIWQLTGVEPKTLQTAYTIGIESTPDAMASRASNAADYELLKVKLDGHQPIERMEAIRSARPSARIVVDANQGWSLQQLKEIAPNFAKLDVEMIEQPLARGQDEGLENYRSPIPLCADESCLHLGELEQARRRYQMINIKLDKTGGLTEALALAERAREFDLGLMVGCMGGTSLAMAPAFVMGCLCDLVDIDGPLLLRNDRPTGLDYDEGMVKPFAADIWG